MQNKPWSPCRLILLMSSCLALMACTQGESRDNHHHGDEHEHHGHALEQHGQAEARGAPSIDPAVFEKIKANPVITRSADSHIHGAANLAVVNENNAIMFELEVPLYSLLGFEFEPKTPDEKARVSEVETLLSEPHNLIAFNPEAKCTYDPFQGHVDLFDAASDDHDDHDEPAEQAHDEHGHEEGHDHESEHGPSHSGDHKDVILNYRLSCEAANEVKSIEVEFFNEFPFLTELQLVYLGPSQQMSAMLSQTRPRAELTR